MIAKLLLFLCVILTLPGCALLSNYNNLAPIPSEKEFNTFSGRLPGIASDKATISDFKKELVTLIGEYHILASDRRKIEYDVTGITTFGGLGAVLGALADRTGLLNTGAAFAGLGLVTSSRYNFNQQSLIYFSAVRRLACINSKLAAIPDTVFVDAINSPDSNAADIAKGAVRQLASLVDTVRIETTNSMLGIAPGVPTREELLVMFKSYLPALAATGAAAPAAPDPDAVRRKDAGEQVKSLLSEVGTCTKS